MAGSPLSLGKVLENLFVLDSHSVVSKINLLKKAISARWIIARAPKANHPFAKNCAISTLGDICYVASESYLTEIYETKESFSHTHTLKWHKTPIEVAQYSNDGHFLATGGMDGRTLIYDVSFQYHLESILDPLGDFISSIIFSDISSKVLVCSFSRKNIIYDLERSCVTHTIKTQSVIECAQFVDHDKKAICFLRDGSIIDIDIHNGAITPWYDKADIWPTASTKTEDQSFILCGAKNGKLIVAQILTRKIVCTIDLPYDCGVSSLQIDGNNLIVGFVTEGVVVIEMDQKKYDFDTFLKIKNFDEVINLLAINPYLIIRDDFDDILNACWPDILDEAMKLLAADKVTEAQKKVSLFIEDKKRASVFHDLLVQKEYVKQFLQAVDIGDYASASQLAQSYPFLRDTIAFNGLKSAWNQKFILVKKLLQENYEGHVQHVTSLLEPFMVFEEFKTLGSALLSNVSKFKEADEAIKNRNFKAYFELVEKYPFLHETQTYHKTLLLGVSLYEKLLKLELEEKFSELGEGIALLKQFPNMTDLIVRFEDIIKTKIAFIEAADKRDITTAYALVLTHPTIIELRSYEILHKTILKEFTSAKEPCANGDVASVVRIVTPYLRIEYWQKKVLSLLKTVYLTDIINADPRQFDKKESLKNLFSCITPDNDMEVRCEEAKLGDIYKELVNENISSFLPEAWPSSFLVRTRYIDDE